MTRLPGRCPPPVLSNRVCHCGYCRRRRGLEPPTDGWGFVYLGANVDAFAEAGSVGISMAAAANYTPDSAGVKAAYSSVSANLASFRVAPTRTAAVAALAVTDEQRKKMKRPTVS